MRFSFCVRNQRGPAADNTLSSFPFITGVNYGQQKYKWAALFGASARVGDNAPHSQGNNKNALGRTLIFHKGAAVPFLRGLFGGGGIF